MFITEDLHFKADESEPVFTKNDKFASRQNEMLVSRQNLVSYASTVLVKNYIVKTANL